jgi:uncharacterized protein YdhG (YjbR/CyaY superfamily)
MGEEDFADYVAAIEEDERRRRTQRTNIFTEYAMEVPRDTIYYIKPCFSDKVTLSFSFKPKYKRICKI